MKRVLSACLYQTIHFILDERFSKEEALLKVNEEVKKYKEQFKDAVQILKEETMEDGTVKLSIRKKVSGYPIGEYFDDYK